MKTTDARFARHPYVQKEGMLSHPPNHLSKLIGNNLLCLFVEYMDLFNIKSKFNSIAGSCCRTGIYSCRNREFSQIKV